MSGKIIGGIILVAATLFGCWAAGDLHVKIRDRDDAVNRYRRAKGERPDSLKPVRGNPYQD